MEKLTGARVYYGAFMVQAISYQSEDVYMIGMEEIQQVNQL